MTPKGQKTYQQFTLGPTDCAPPHPSQDPNYPRHPNTTPKGHPTLPISVNPFPKKPMDPLPHLLLPR